jgi:hypothetical protein
MYRWLIRAEVEVPTVVMSDGSDLEYDCMGIKRGSGGPTLFVNPALMRDVREALGVFTIHPPAPYHPSTCALPSIHRRLLQISR